MKNVKIADLPKPQEKIFKDFHAETKADEGEGKRILVAKISTPNADRSKDHVLAKGAVTTNFMKNLGLLGAMLFIVANGAGAWSIDSCRKGECSK